MHDMEATYPEIAEDDEIGGFSVGALSVVILLAAVPVLLALVIITARGNASPAPTPQETPTVLQQAKLFLEEIKAVAFPPEAVEYAAVDADATSEIDLAPRGSEPVYDVSEALEIDFLTPPTFFGLMSAPWAMRTSAAPRSLSTFEEELQQLGHIRNVQWALVDRGYLETPVVGSLITGTLDDRTRKALEAFQRDSALAVTGSVDDQTLLGLELEEAIPPDRLGLQRP